MKRTVDKAPVKRTQQDTFHKLISPLGSDGAENPTYSPAREVTGAAPQPGQAHGHVSTTGYSKNERRGG